MPTTRRIDKPQRKTGITHDIFDRQPPSSIKTEHCLLGSILLKPDVCDDVLLILRPHDFYDDVNRSLFEQMVQMYESGHKFDTSLLAERLKQQGILEEIGGVAFLARIAGTVPHAAHAVEYARHIRENAARRELIDASTQILQSAYDTPAETRELLSLAEQRIFSILDRRHGTNLIDMNAMMHNALDRLDARMKGESLSDSVQTGFTELDSLTGGLHNSELVVLAARPSMGKTALAMNIAEYAAIHENVPVLLVSLEMAATELIDRMLCSIAKVNGHRLRNGTISKDERRRFAAKAGEISAAPLYVDDSPSRTMVEISAAARRLKRREKNFGLVVIDYLQLIEPDNPRDPRQEQVARIARRLKGMARELSVPVLCLAQLNRQTETMKDNRPRLSHLRESGAIEQDADVVMFVHREEYYHSGEDRDQFAGEAEVIVSKQRNGPVGDVSLLWQKEYTRFVNPATRHLDDYEGPYVVEDPF